MGNPDLVKAAGRSSRALPLVGLVLLSALLALPTLDNGFSLDDYNWLERATFRGSDLSFLLQPEPGQVFNPVGRGVFLALFGLAGTNPLPYRLAILALHVANVCLLFVLVERLFARRDLALVAAFLFAVERSYDEALFWIAAFFHPLNATLCLAALLGYLSFLQSGSRVARFGALLALAAALLTKAPAFPLALLFLVVPVGVGGLGGGARRSAGWRDLVPIAAVWTAGVAINLALGVDQSYLLERGYYRLGWHMVPNLADYLAWMILPFGAVAGKLGALDLHRTLLAIARFVVPAMLAVACVRGDRRVRFFVGFGLLALVAFLPFTFEPTSRYTYLSAVGLAPVLAAGVLAAGARLAARRGVGMLAAALLSLVALANTVIVDNDYEYRERLAQVLVADVEAALPVLPADREVRIAGLPSFGIDPGIHLEAALRLAYEEPALHLEVMASTAGSWAGETLRYTEGRILPPLIAPDTTAPPKEPRRH